MRKLLLRQLLLASRKEKTARVIQFDPSMTVIRGENGVGKSALIKSIFWCLGAEPAKWSKGWTDLDICGSLHFSIGEKEFSLLRYGNIFGLFDKNYRLVRSFSSITDELGPYLAELFEFGLMLAPRSGNPEVPPPAYFLLPSYIDQDKGWQDIWSSFNRLHQYNNWKDDVAAYHIGLYDNEFYRLKAHLSTIRRDLDEPIRQEASLAKVMDQVRNKYAELPVDFNVNRYKRELDELVSNAKEFAAEEENYRRTISTLEGERIFLIQKNHIARRIMKELDADFQYASIEDVEVCCPTCGAIYQNTLIEKFRLAWDFDYCQTVVNDTQIALFDIERQLSLKHTDMMNIHVRHTKVWELLEAHQDALTLHQIIQGEARGQAVSAIQNEVDSIRNIIKMTDAEIADIERKIEKYRDQERRKVIMQRFCDILGRYAVELNVSIPVVSKRIACSLLETGSDLPRAVLCYVFAVLHMAWQNNQYFCPPIIVDSPKQQDQDTNNYRAMLDFIKSNRPEGSQMILGVVDMHGVDLGGYEIVLTRQKQMLEAERYHTTGKLLSELLFTIYNDRRNKSTGQIPMEL